MTALGSLALGVVIGVLTVTDCSAQAPVFIADQLFQTFKVLDDRQCLPTNFDVSRTVPAASACSPMVSAGNLPVECAGVPVLALFYNCYSRSYGTLNAGATSFDVARLKRDLTTNTDDQVWTRTWLDMVDKCTQASAPGLTERQTAVFTYLCLKWSLFSDCDHQQEERGSLDAMGQARRARFLASGCPQSRSKVVTGKRIFSCVYEQANQVASQFPDTCDIFVDVN